MLLSYDGWQAWCFSTASNGTTVLQGPHLLICAILEACIVKGKRYHSHVMSEYHLDES